MQGIPWAELSFGVVALIIVGFIVLGAYKLITNSNKSTATLMGNHINHLTQALEKGFDTMAESQRDQAASNRELREHCAATIARREADVGKD